MGDGNENINNDFSLEISNLRRKYYTSNKVLYPILECIKDKEVIFMHKEKNELCKRNVFIKNIDFLKKAFDIINIYDRNYNIYISCEYYRGMVTQKFLNGDEKRIADSKIDFSIFYDYDILLDFDSSLTEYNALCEEVETILALLIRYDINHYIIPSGSRWHIVLKNHMLLPLPEVKVFVYNLKKRFSLKFLDLKGVGARRKIMKCPYSLVGNIIVYPLAIHQFRYYKVAYRELTPNFVNILGFFDRQRNYKMWSHSLLTEDAQKNNFIKFINYFDLLNIDKTPYRQTFGDVPDYDDLPDDLKEAL